MSGAGGPARVLVVEDDASVRAVLSTVLTVEGFAVETASDGLEGLLKLRIHTPVAVLLDIAMPDVGGARVLDELAETQSAPPVIVITGSHEDAEKVSERLGAENVFTKPLDLERLVARVRALSDGSES